MRLANHWSRADTELHIQLPRPTQRHIWHSEGFVVMSWSGWNILLVNTEGHFIRVPYVPRSIAGLPLSSPNDVVREINEPRPVV